MKKCYEYNKLKRLIASSLLVLMPFTVGASEKDTKYDDSLNINYVDSSLEQNSKKKLFDNIENSYYEIEDRELNDAINQIIQLNYISGNKNFDVNHVYNMPTNVLKSLNEHDSLNNINSNYYPINYNWYDGKINSNLLYERIIENQKNSKLPVGENEKAIARLIAVNYQSCIDYILNIDPNYDFRIPFYNINNIKVECFNNDNLYANYKDGKIGVNVSYLNDEIVTKCIRHELFHELLNNSTLDSDVVIYGASIDDLYSKETPFTITFMSEKYADLFAQDSLYNNLRYNEYGYEQECIDNLCLSTNKTSKYYQNCFVKADISGIINSFEEELREINFVYSTLSCLNSSCGYDYFKDEVDKDIYMQESSCYASVNLMKNFFIRNIKELYKGNISIEEYKKNINELQQMYNIYEGSILYTYLKQMIDITNDYVNSNRKVK